MDRVGRGELEADVDGAGEPDDGAEFEGAGVADDDPGFGDGLDEGVRFTGMDVLLRVSLGCGPGERGMLAPVAESDGVGVNDRRAVVLDGLAQAASVTTRIQAPTRIREDTS